MLKDFIRKRLTQDAILEENGHAEQTGLLDCESGNEFLITIEINFPGMNQAYSAAYEEFHKISSSGNGPGIL